MLRQRGWLPSPTVVKLDVDGRESAIICGMQRTLASPERPREIQTEIQRRDRGDVIELMSDLGYRMKFYHLSIDRRKARARGRSLDEMPYNAVFVPAPHSGFTHEGLGHNRF